MQQTGKTEVIREGRRLVYFGGCDYYRLSRHPSVLRALERGAARYGLNVAASRLTTGEHRLYPQLEDLLARTFDAPSATLLANGYLANLAAAQAMAGEFSHAIVDQRSHSSLKHAARLLGCPVLLFNRDKPQTLEKRIRQLRGGARPLLMTDGLFAHDGSVAPLRAWQSALPRNGWMMVDDAHGAGVLGRTGKGSVELEGLSRARLVQTITLSKAYGVYGGAVLGSTVLQNRIRERSPIYAGNTPLPLPLAFAAMRSVHWLSRHPGLRARLERNADYVKSLLRDAGWNIPRHPGPILSIAPSTTKTVGRLKHSLLAAGIHPPFICYPGGPAGGHFRFAISSEHTRKDLTRLASVLTDFRQSGRDFSP